jgi:carboxymethylenebutenolidase
MPDDSKIYIPRTVGKDQVVDDLILKFTHSREIDYRIPGIAPTGKYVELPRVVVIKFVGNKIAHEHIHRYQASLLAQIGLLDANNLPVIFFMSIMAKIILPEVDLEAFGLP